MSLSSDFLIAAYEAGYCTDSAGNLFFNENIVHLKVSKNSGIPYYYFTFRQNNRTLPIYLHRLVAYQKYGSKIFDKSLVVRHLNSNSLDNSHTNIELGTYSDNAMDRPKDLRVAIARRISRKLSDELVKQVRELSTAGVPRKKIQVEFGLSKSTVGRIIRKQRYAEI